MFRQIALFSVGLIALGIATFSHAASGLEAALTSSPINVSQAELEIRTALVEKVSLEFNDTPLTAVMTFIHDKYHLQFQFDTAGLTYTNQGQTVKIDPAKLPVTINLKNVTLRSALNLILSPHNLAWTIKDEVLLVTTQEEAASMLETRIYDVRDLVVQDIDRSGTPDFDPLIDTIHTTVNPQSWDIGGGQGTISGFANNGIVGLVVWQNYDGQEQVENLLAKLRMLKPVRAVRQ